MTDAQLATYRSPWTEDFDGTSIHFRMMTPDDFKTVLRFANSLPESDLIYLRLDITDPGVVERWVENVRTGATTTIIAEENGRMAGYGSLHTDGPYWTRHHGEVRLMIAPAFRAKGIGHLLFRVLSEVARDKGLDRVVAQIPANQPRVREMLESLGFAPAALMTDWLKDRNGRTHDLVIMSKELRR